MIAFPDHQTALKTYFELVKNDRFYRLPSDIKAQIVLVMLDAIKLAEKLDVEIGYVEKDIQDALSKNMDFSQAEDYVNEAAKFRRSIHDDKQ